VFISEPNEAQIVANYLQREAASGEQTFRAHVSWLYSNWLKGETDRLGLIALPARPWDDLFERILAALG
jgi:hypothetical protein